MTVSNEILSRIAKIKNLADRAGTLGEAEAASAALTRLLIQHNLSMADLDRVAEQEKRPVTDQRFDLGSRANWQRELVWSLAHNNLCRALLTPGTTRMTLIGHEHNLIVVKEMFLWLRDELLRLAKESHAEMKARPWPERPEERTYGTTPEEVEEYRWKYDDLPPGVKAFREARMKYRAELISHNDAKYHGKAWVNSFLRGAVHGLDAKMRAEREAIKAEVGNQGWALVPVLEEEVEDYLKAKWPRLGGSHNSGSVSNSAAYNSGFAAGQSVSTRRQVGGYAALT